MHKQKHSLKQHKNMIGQEKQKRKQRRGETKQKTVRPQLGGFLLLKVQLKKDWKDMRCYVLILLCSAVLCCAVLCFSLPFFALLLL